MFKSIRVFREDGGKISKGPSPFRATALRALGKFGLIQTQIEQSLQNRALPLPAKRYFLAVLFLLLIAPAVPLERPIAASLLQPPESKAACRYLGVGPEAVECCAVIPA